MVNPKIQRLKKKQDIVFKIFKVFIIICCIAAMSIFIILLLGIVSGMDNYSTVSIITVICLIVSACICFICFEIIKKLKYKIQVESGQFHSTEEAEDYDIEARERANREYQNKQKKRREEIYRAQHPQCPACNGNNTRRITATHRAVSTTFMGVASDTVGKQYECLDCLHKW